jgi:hypothetical protein
MTYSYRFPESSEFARLNINTVGSVFANIQNKPHSICTINRYMRYKKNKYIHATPIGTRIAKPSPRETCKSPLRVVRKRLPR